MVNTEYSKEHRVYTASGRLSTAALSSVAETESNKLNRGRQKST